MVEPMGGGERAELGRDTGRLEIFAVVLDALGRAPRCVVFERLHWADEATLDLLAYLGRRIERTHVLLLLSYRDDEIDPLHPLRRVLGALRRRLREAGVRGLARGTRPWTREHPQGLTTREAQVLQLLCQGLRNAEIAQRLSRPVRTVDHHLAAVFAKLGVESRVAALQAAQRAGLQAPSGQSAQSAQSGQALPPK